MTTNRNLRSLITAIVICAVAYGAWSSTAAIRTAIGVAEIQALPTQAWLDVKSFNVVVTDDQPIALVTYQVNRPVRIRTTITPRNTQTGEIVCSGRTGQSTFNPAQPVKMTVPLSMIAGLPDCVFPPGEYHASLTWMLIDDATNVEAKQLVWETNNFTVGGGDGHEEQDPAGQDQGVSQGPIIGNTD